MLRRILLSVICLAAFTKSEPNTTELFDHNAMLDSSEKLHLYWNFNKTDIVFEFHGHTLGWIGIGVSPGGSMVNADVIVGWVKNGNAYITDRHGPASNGFPPLDTVQNVRLLEGYEVDGWTVIKFHRLLVTCDDEDLDLTVDTMKFIFAWGETDPTGNDLTAGDYHTPERRGAKSLIVLEPSRRDETMFPEGESHVTFDLLNNNFSLPALDTYYNCRLLKLPELSTKHHLVKVEPMVQLGHELYVHHMLIYHCTDHTSITTEGVESECYRNMPPDFTSCRFPLIAWAIGGGAFHFPKHAGLALGTADAPKYVVLETHYDNPAVRGDIVDSSGLRIFYTPDLRENDAGVMEVGKVVNGFQQVIPPNAESFLEYGECSENCLSNHMENEGHDSVQAFAVLLHSHLLGRELYLKHIRNDSELPYLAKDASYDFNYQETRHLADERPINKGDSLQMICQCNSLHRTNLTMVQGGLSSDDEMCLSYVYYYPKMKLSLCETGPEINTLAAYFGVTQIQFVPSDDVPSLHNFQAMAPPEHASKTLYEVINTRHWDQQTATSFSLALKNMVREQICRSTGNTLPGVTAQVLPPNIEFPFVEMAPNCTAEIAENSVDSPIIASSVATIITGSDVTTVSEEDWSNSGPRMEGLHVALVLPILLQLWLS